MMKIVYSLCVMFSFTLLGMQQSTYQATQDDFDFVLQFINDKENDITKNTNLNSYFINLGNQRTGVVAGNNGGSFTAFADLKYKNNPVRTKIKFNPTQAQQIFERMASGFSKQGSIKEKTIEE